MPGANHLDLLTEVVARIERELREPASVGSLCESLDMSPWQFQRVFRAFTGDSVGTYLRGRRLTVAAETLRKNSGARILDIALEFQFGSQEAFTRAFKLWFGVTPAEYRDGDQTLNPRHKPRLDRERISRIHANIAKTPTYLTLPPSHFVGSPIDIASPLDTEADICRQLPQHWLEFNRRRHEIAGRERGVGYGIAASSTHGPDGMDGETLHYIAAARVDALPRAVPAEMKSVSISGGKYAVFERTGHVEACFATVGYIYGVWLPQSGLLRGPGPDLEIFDHRYRLADPSSRSRYYLPIL
jgi:AraC family transcriptional regulator